MSCAPPQGSAFALIRLLPTAADLPACLPYALLVDFIWRGPSPLAMSPAQPCHQLLVRAFPRLRPEPLSYTTRCSLWCSYLMCWEARALFFLVSKKKKKKPSPEKDVTLSATIQFLCALPLSAGLKFGLKVLPSELSYKPYFCRFQNLPKKGNKWTAEDHILPFLILPPCSAPWSVVKRLVLCWSSNLKPGDFSIG